MPPKTESGNAATEKPANTDGKSLIVAPDSSLAEPSKKPDQYTKQDPTFIKGGAPNQIFKFERWGIAYGTDDKGHAASIILSVLLVALLAGVAFGGLFVERMWMPDMLKLLGTAFTFTAGVAIGKSSTKK